MPLVVTTENRDFKPLGARIDYVLEARERLRELGPDYVTLLAEPRSESGRTSWFIDGSVTARPASSLSQTESSALYDRLHDMRVEINGLAASIANPSGRRTGDQDLAQALRRIAVVPNDEHFVWSVNGKPLLVNWGQVYINDNRSEQAIIGDGLLPRKVAWTLPQAPPPALGLPASSVPANRWYLPLLTWLLFVGLMGAIYFLLLRSCGTFLGSDGSPLARFLPNACQIASRPDPSILAERADLEQRIKEAQLNLSHQINDCPPPPPPNQSLDEETRRRNEREHATHGKLEISLRWDGLEDLDLHVKCPGGELSFNSPKTNDDHHEFCGGILDVDMNSLKVSPTPVEHAFWASPPDGAYEVYVEFWSLKDQPPRSIPFTVVVQREGQPTRTFTGTLTGVKEESSVYKFTIP